VATSLIRPAISFL